MSWRISQLGLIGLSFMAACAGENAGENAAAGRVWEGMADGGRPDDGPTAFVQDAATAATPDQTSPGPADANLTVVPPSESDAAIDATALDAAADTPEGGAGPLEPGIAPPQKPLCGDGGCPTAVQNGHLQLWLRADREVECADSGHDGGAASRATVWRDLSPNNRDARPMQGGYGPRCDLATVGGKPVLSFGSVPDDGREGMQVDFGFLANKPFTIAIVEKRRTSQTAAAYLLGSVLEFNNAACDLPNQNSGHGLFFGYLTADLLVASTWGGDCDAIAPVSASAERMSLHWISHAPGKGIVLRSAGSGADTIVDTAPDLTQVKTGLIGRGWQLDTGTGRSLFSGDIAELIFFDVALSEKERGEVRGYLEQQWDAIQ